MRNLQPTGAAAKTYPHSLLGAARPRMLAGHRRIGLAVFGFELILVGFGAGALAETRTADTSVWTWAAVWVALRLIVGGAQYARTLRSACIVPVITGVGVVVIGFAAEHFLSPARLIGEVMAVAFVLTGISLMTRVAVLVFYRPRTVRLVCDAADAPPADTHRVHHIALTPRITDDPAALTSAVLQAVDAFDAVAVDLCEGLDRDTTDQLMWALRHHQVSLRVPLSVTTVRAQNLKPELTAGDASLVCMTSAPPLRLRVTKRLFDILGSAALIVVLSPVLITVALLVKRDSPGPVIFRQTRIGVEGEEFQILKFRTMVADADAQLARLLKEQNRGDTPLFKIDSDPRITRTGGVLRRFSLDELPQLFNVLGGSMSLVGPRPQRAEEVALYTPTAVQRLGVKPGMTGLWQVSGRSNLPWERAQQLDVYYANNWTLGLDLAILVRTIRAVLAREGAV